MEAIFIGDSFYFDSGTMMSSVYEIDAISGLNRTDWGMIRRCLSEGKSVHIRPATEAELSMFKDLLDEYKKK